MDGVRNVLSFGIIQVPIMLGLALLAALILDGRTRLAATRSTGWSIFLPFAVPGVVAALVWGYLYGQQFGPVAQIARALNVAPPQFLTPATIIPALANISTWQYTGYNMLILYAALKAIPTELYEAARVDGASGLPDRPGASSIPLILPALVLTFIFSIIGTLQLFSEPRVINAIAPTRHRAELHAEPVRVPAGLRRTASSTTRRPIAFTLAVVTAVLSALRPLRSSTGGRANDDVEPGRSTSSTGRPPQAPLFQRLMVDGFLIVLLAYVLIPLVWLVIAMHQVQRRASFSRSASGSATTSPLRRTCTTCSRATTAPSAGGSEHRDLRHRRVGRRDADLDAGPATPSRCTASAAEACCSRSCWARCSCPRRCSPCRSS